MPPSGPLSFREVLWVELCKLRPGFEKTAKAPTSTEDKKLQAEELRELNRKIGGGRLEPLSALCLSGGGIRSATFNLGVIQGLARLDLLGRFDYLSSVSGGGYIASWLRTWMARRGSAEVVDELATTPGQRNVDPLCPEPRPIDHLREYSNYLSPRLGLMSADTWTLAAIVSRNLLLNWLVLVPLLAALVCIPQFWLLVVRSAGPLHGRVMLGAALAAALFASASTHYWRRYGKAKSLSQSGFVLRCVLPICAASTLLAVAARWGDIPWRYEGESATAEQIQGIVGYALLWCLVLPILGWAFSAFRKGREDLPSVRAELRALFGSGAVAAAVLVWVTYGWFGALSERPALYAIFAVPILLGVYLIARTLFVGLVSPSGLSRSQALAEDSDREWWARLAGWILLMALGATALSAIVLCGGWLVERFRETWLPEILAGVGGVSGLLVKLLGGGAGTSSGKEGGGETSGSRNVILGLAAPAFAICLLVLLSMGTAWIWQEITGQSLNAHPKGFTGTEAPGEQPLYWAFIFLLLPLAAILFSLGMGLIVNVNRFSLQGMYRNRLVRAYLGASNPGRNPDPFTGFDPEDNLRVHELWRESQEGDRGPATRPLPVINCALNLVSTSSEKLAWQQRKAESFSITPFYCGNFGLGYRPSKEYGGYSEDGPTGISVGTAVAISGAAANPNMGFHSSPVLSFLMTLFNARLGAWLGNTAAAGETTYRRTGPVQAVRPLLSELFGMTNNRSPYVNLSDGGHFENLGIYEMVLRRCRFIVVCDAANDPALKYDDLGNAVRKIRIDFGIPIEFQEKLRILPKGKDGIGVYCAIGRILYHQVDGTDAALDGDLIYIKPSMEAGGSPDPQDVYSYSQGSRDFPHETTADQFFSESQFESYRALGSHLIQLLGDSGAGSFVGFKKSVEGYLKARAQG